MDSGNGIFNSAHRDVLEAKIPDETPSKERFLEELKNRAKGAVGCKSWRDAQLLYEKAIQVVNSIDKEDKNKEISILNSNLSLVHGKMGHLAEAETTAETATKMDPTYVKGWWRLGSALSMLQNYTKALECMEKAKTLDPTNKALVSECNKLKKLAASASSTPKEATKTATTTTTTTQTSKPTTSKSSNQSAVVKGEIDKEFTKSDHVKGYKIVNGKKTSYFHNELSEEAKQLIGDIAPKKLEDTAVPMETSSTTQGTTSVWNKAGTWEEKDITTWAKENLKKALSATKYIVQPKELPAGEGWDKFISSNMVQNDITASITKVTIVDGHASVATVRNKKRYIYEFEIKLEWKISDGDDEVFVKGSMTFPDIDGTCEVGKGYDMSEYSIKENFKQGEITHNMLNNTIQKSGLRDSIHQAIDNWVRLFHETY